MPEHQNIEYKQSWHDDYLKWICGFANAYGGTIYIGKDDNGNVVGVPNAKKLLEDIPNKVRDILGIMVDVNLHTETGKEYLEILIEPQSFPVNYKGQYHYRSGATKQELKGAALDKFLLQKKGKRWDGVPVPKVFVADLKKETLDFFRRRAARSGRIEEDVLTDTDEHLIENLQLKEGEYLKRAALLLFHPMPEKFVTGAYVKIGYFETDDDLRFQDEAHGNLFEQLEKTMDLLYSKYFKGVISYEGIHRVETFDYPREAIREALLNALAHKDYASGIPIQISVYQDKLMMWNDGQLPEDWTVERLLTKHPSKPYNPDIANAFFRSGYIELWGRGTLKIVRECIAAGLPQPVYSYDFGGVFIEFRKDIYHEEYLKSLGLNERQLKAVLYIKDKGSISSTVYQKLNDIGRTTAAVDLQDLVIKGLLVQVGLKGRGIKYVLPAK